MALFTQCNIFTSFSYKIGPIKCLTHRAFKISSSYMIFHNEINKTKSVLQKNLYTAFVTDNKNIDKIF